MSPGKGDHPVRVKSTSEAEIRRRLIDEAPPIPPPPLNYEPPRRQSGKLLIHKHIANRLVTIISLQCIVRIPSRLKQCL